MQSMTFPTLWYAGRYSPFECPPPRFEKQAEQGEKKIRFVYVPLFEGYRILLTVFKALYLMVNFFVQ